MISRHSQKKRVIQIDITHVSQSSFLEMFTTVLLGCVRFLKYIKQHAIKIPLCICYIINSFIRSFKNVNNVHYTTKVCTDKLSLVGTKSTLSTQSSIIFHCVDNIFFHNSILAIIIIKEIC